MKDTSGPAFPVAAYTLSIEGNPMLMVKDGMTLRQWYAGMAMQGLLAADTGGDYAYIAKEAGALADAMIEESHQ